MKNIIKGAFTTILVAASLSAAAQKGPGLGNLNYSASEQFKRISLVDGSTGIPDNSGSPAAKFGLNMGYMFNGYFVGVFAPDHGHSSGGWLVLDVSNPRNPQMVARRYESQYSHGGPYNGYSNGQQDRHFVGSTGDFRENHGTGFSIQDGRYYAAIATGYGVEIWDFTDIGPGSPPQPVSALDIPNIAAGDYTNTSWQLTWQAPYLYVANANQGVTVVDTSDIRNPKVLSRTPISAVGGMRVGPIFVMGNHMVVSSMESAGRIASLDISDPGKPRLLATFEPGQRFYASCFNGNQVMVSNRGTPAYMQVIDISDPSRFVEMHKNQIRTDEALYCSAVGNMYISGNQNDITVVDMSNPSNPQLRGRGELAVGAGSDHGQVSIFGNLVYVGNDHGAGNGFIVHQAAADTAAPHVTQVSPRNGVRGQALTSRIGLSMSDNIMVSSMNPDTFIVREVDTKIKVIGTYSAQGSIINFAPATALKPNTAYEIVVPRNGMKDWVGNATTEQFVSTFITGDGSNPGDSCTSNCPISGGNASASSSEGGHPASHGNDGDYSTRWTASNGSTGQWFQVDYGAPRPFTGAQMTFEFPRSYGYVIEVSANGNNWSEVLNRTNNPDSTIQQKVEFSQVVARYMRIRFTQLPENSWAALYEFSALEPQNDCVANGDESCFVRLVATSEVNGNPWTSAAELSVLDRAMNPLPLLAIDLDFVDSEELVGEDGSAYNAIDGNPSTIWHTQWQTASPTHPHTLSLKLEEPQVLGGIRYLPRQVGENGRIGNYRVEVSRDGNTWRQMASGNFPNSASEQTVRFELPPQPVSVTLGSQGAAEVGQSSTFNAEGSGGNGNLEYYFDFGDGNNSGGYSRNASASHTYTSPGHYPVIVTVRDGSQSTSTASQLHTVHRALTANKPTRSASIQFANGKVYAVNSDNDSVSAFDAQSLQKLWEAKVGKHPRSIAVAANGDLWVTNQDDATLSFLSGSSGATLNTVNMPRASQPFGIVFSPDSNRLFVSLTAKGEVAQLNPNTGNIERTVGVGESPRGLAVTADSQSLYVTRFISLKTQGEVRKLNTANLSLEKVIVMQDDTTTVDGEDRAQGIPNYVASITISPDAARAWVPSQKVNTRRGSFLNGKDLTFESTVRTIVSQLNLNNDTEDFSVQTDFNDGNLATDAVLTPLGDYAFIALQANNRVEIRDAYSGSAIGALTTDLAPKGLAMNEDGTRLYVHNFLGRSIDVFDTTGIIDGTQFIAPKLANIETVAQEALDARVLKGKQIFYNAADTRMALDGYMSCASCHLDGDSDGRVWDFSDRGEGLRNTRSLVGAAGTRDGNVHWTANFDEVHDFENDIRNEFGGSGFLSNNDFANTSDPLGRSKAGLNEDLDALVAYVTSLDITPPSPHRNQDGSLTADAQNGKAIFERLDCASCHSGEFFTDGKRWDVGTIQTSSGKGAGQSLNGIGFDTPSLLGLWFKAPYLHNGQAETITDVLNSSAHGGTNTLSSSERSQLAAYLLQLESSASSLHDVSRWQVESNSACIDVAGSSEEEGDAVLVWGCHDGPNQRWELNARGNNTFNLRAEHSGMCLDVEGASTAEGAKLIQWPCSNGANQQWKAVPTGNNYYQLQAGHSGLCLTAANDGSLEQQRCTNGTDQHWRQATHFIGGGSGFNETIQAENFTNSGGIQTENTTDTGGGLNVGWIDATDWMSFVEVVNIPRAGTYTVKYRVASLNGGTLSADLNAGNIQLGEVQIPATGGWQNWITVEHQVQLPAGPINYGIFARTGGWNINWFNISN